MNFFRLGYVSFTFSLKSEFVVCTCFNFYDLKDVKNYVGNSVYIISSFSCISGLYS